MKRHWRFLIIAGCLVVTLILGMFLGHIWYAWSSPDLAEYYTFDNAPYSGFSYVVFEDSGSYYYRNLVTGALSGSSGNDTDRIQYCINQSESSGGSVYVKSGSYSASVVLKDNVTLLLEKGATGVTVGVDGGADAALVDEENGYRKEWVSGSLYSFMDYRTGEHWYAGENRTDLIVHPSSESSFIIETDGTDTWMTNTSTGQRDATDTDAGNILNWAYGNLTGGGKIFVKAGTYNLKSLVTPEDNVHLWGEGYDSTIIRANDSLDGHMFYGNVTHGNDNIGFHYIGFDGNTAGQSSAQNMITISKTDNSIIEHCKFWNIGKHAVMWSGNATDQPVNNRFIYNIVDGNNAGKDGTDMLGFGYQHHSVFSHNYMTVNHTSCIALVSRAPFHSTFEDNTFNNTGSTSFNLESAYYCNIRYNTILSSGGAGFGIGNSSIPYGYYGFPRGCNIIGNFVNASGTHGFSLNGDHHVIQDNTISYSQQHGISLLGDNNDVGFNRIYNNDQGASTSSGIRLGSGSLYNRIHNNDLYDNQASATQDYGLRIKNGNNYTQVMFNNFTGNAVSAVDLGGASYNCEFYQNLGYVTENSGSATISNTDTVSIAHSLAGTPTVFFVSYNVTGYGDWYWTANATYVDVTLASSVNATIYWRAIYEP